MSTRGNDWLLHQAQRTLNRLVHSEKGKKGGISSRNLSVLQRSVDGFISQVFSRLRDRVKSDDVYQRDLNRIRDLSRAGADEFSSSMLVEEHALLQRYFHVNTHYKLDLLKKYFKSYYQLESPGQKGTIEEWNAYTRQQMSNRSSLEGAHSSVLSMLESKISACEKKYLSDLSARFCSLVTRHFEEKAAKVRLCNSMSLPADQFLKKRPDLRKRKKSSGRDKKYEQATLGNTKQESFAQDGTLPLGTDGRMPKSQWKPLDTSDTFDPNANNGRRADFSKDELDLANSDDARGESGEQDGRYDRLADELMRPDSDDGSENRPQDSAADGSGGGMPSGAANAEQTEDAAGENKTQDQSGGFSGESRNQQENSGVKSSEERTSRQSPAGRDQEGAGFGEAGNKTSPQSGKSPEPDSGVARETPEHDGGEPAADGASCAEDGDGAPGPEGGAKTSETDAADGTVSGERGDGGAADGVSGASDIPVIDLSELMGSATAGNTGIARENSRGESVQKSQTVPDGATGTGRYALADAGAEGGDEGEGLGFESLEDMLNDLGLGSGNYDETGACDPNPDNFWTHQYWLTGSWKDADGDGSGGREGEPQDDVYGADDDQASAASDPAEKFAREVDNWFNDLADELVSGKGQRFLGPGVSEGYLTRDDMSDYLHYFSVVENNTGIQKLLNLLGKKMELDRSAEAKVRFGSGRRDRTRHPDMLESMSGITLGNQINYVLPEELVKIADEDTEPVFDVNYLESNLLRFDLDGIADVSYGGNERIKSSPRKGRGPVVLCVDTSSSMQGVPESYAKAVVMSLALKSHAARRDCYIINFSVHIEKLLLKEDDEDAEDKLLVFLNKSFNGGSDLDEALQECLTLMQNDPRFYRSDVLCVTDGQIDFSEQLANLVRRRRQAEHNRFYELVIGSMANEAYWLQAGESIRRQRALFDHLYELSTDGRWMREVKMGGAEA
ncbi:MAG: VWA domain-containing protein [Succinivibrionaceae bacterium]|nr:VWA domain-containing protein [Succinivibrionaceae bacterium]